MEYAPINPSDTYCLDGTYGKTGIMEFECPVTPGWEGSGVVVANGGGLNGWRLLGKRVAVSKSAEPDEGKLTIGGAYQQYMVTGSF